MNKPEFDVIIAGTRTFNDYKLLNEKVSAILKDKLQTHQVNIVCGLAKGADTLGMRWAYQNDLYVKRFPANWDLYGKRAGYLRNWFMASVADACIVFWDGKSKGSKHMIDVATRKGIPLRIIRYE